MTHATSTDDCPASPSASITSCLPRQPEALPWKALGHRGIQEAYRVRTAFPVREANPSRFRGGAGIRPSPSGRVLLQRWPEWKRMNASSDPSAHIALLKATSSRVCTSRRQDPSLSARRKGLDSFEYALAEARRNFGGAHRPNVAASSVASVSIPPRRVAFLRRESGVGSARREPSRRARAHLCETFRSFPVSCFLSPASSSRFADDRSFTKMVWISWKDSESSHTLTF